MNFNDLNPTPNFYNAETKQVAKYLNVIILASLVINPIHSLVLFYSLSNPIAPLIANGLLFLTHTASLYLLNRKQIKNAAIFNLIGGWLYFSFTTFILGGASSPAILGFFIIVLMASLLLNNRWTYFFTALTILYAICVFFIETYNQLPENIIKFSPLYSWGTFIFAILILVIIYELSTEKLNIALEASRRNVEALNEKNKLLEETQKALQQNLSELSKAESALRLSKKHLQTVVESAPVILWTSDIDGRMTLLEGKTLSNIQIEANQFQGETIFSALGNRVKGLKTIFEQVLQGETVVSIENLKGHIFEIHFSPLFEGDVVNGIMGVAIDITERIQAQDAMINLQKTESLGVLAGGIAHDFNNLLVGILGQASVGLYKMQDNHQAKKHIEKVILAAEKAGNLTHQLLAYSGRGQIKIESLDLNELVSENINLFQTAVSRNIAFNIILHPNELIVRGDVTQLQQVIMNLIINGAEAITHHTGEILIKTFVTTVHENSKETEWERGALVIGKYAGVEISDNGAGMSQEVLKKIFDPFFTTKNTGQGLGLAAVQGIVRSHNGTLDVESKLNSGTTFKVLLPLAKSAQSRQKPENSHGSKLNTHISTILQIDDDPAVSDTLVDILSTQDINVFSALTRQSGLEIFQQNYQEIDLIILDMTMPGLSLNSIITELKNVCSETPIIVSSGFIADNEISQFNSNQTQGFISKPYSKDDFISQLIEILKPASD